MKKFALRACLLGLMLGTASSAFAYEFSVTQTGMQNGATLYVFNDGKMSMTNEYGHVVSMPVGTLMQSKDGRQIAMDSNETARLVAYLHLDHKR
ncbi:CopK family periplasmic copper-binding protein [Paludibacterium purpuratum]|uniref:Copper resistance protein K n=1 Tax=Paludibacterium purpuratum TaxID=1144873 RepID=A0A4V3DUW3_9NEIS|nr:CopK family periplasmic copper-binding protein [Paludibacterium purpuratum]TDR77837.1 copper resistance protein K [Paludibacterium purpuratum]